jgi:hypothetical protein
MKRWQAKHRAELADYCDRWRQEQKRRADKAISRLRSQGHELTLNHQSILTRTQMQQGQFTVINRHGRFARREKLYDLEREIPGVLARPDPLAARGKPREKESPLHEAARRAIQKLLENYSERQILKMLESNSA